MNKKILIIIILILFVGALALLLLLPQGGTPVNGKANLIFWCVDEPSSTYAELIAEYQDQNPNVTVTYVEKSFNNDKGFEYKGQYQVALEERIVKGDIDIACVHNSWVAKYIQNISPAPSGMYSESAMRINYYNAINEVVISSNGYVMAAPYAIDGLVLIYNKDILSKIGVQDNMKMASLTKDWDGLANLAKNLTARDTNGRVSQYGIALGTVSNITYSPEIMMAMLTQAGVEIVSDSPYKAKLSTEEAKAAISRYYSFSSFSQVWSSKAENDITAFSSGRVAMIIAPSRKINAIQALNPNIKLDIVPIPSLAGASRTTPQYLASFWVQVVPRKSANSTNAWKFIKWLSEPEQLRKIRQAQNSSKIWEIPYARTDMAAESQSNAYGAAVMQMAPRMKSWKLFDMGTWEYVFKKHLVKSEDFGGYPSSELKSAETEINQLIYDNIK